MTFILHGVGCRDCLAAAGADGAAINGGAGAGFTKSKTCYKCQQEGHVRLLILEPRSSVRSADGLRLPQIARDCPDNAEYAT